MSLETSMFLLGIVIGWGISMISRPWGGPPSLDETKYWEGFRRGARHVHDELTDTLESIYKREGLERDKPPGSRSDSE